MPKDVTGGFNTSQHACSSIVFSDEESAWLSAMDSHKRSTGNRFPTLTQILAVLKSLGYSRPEPKPDPILVLPLDETPELSWVLANTV